MASIKLNHSSGNSTILNSPAANPSSDVTLKLPSTTGSAGQVLSVASANHSATNAELEFVAAGGGKLVNYDSTSLTGVNGFSVGQAAYSSDAITLSYAAASSSNKLLIIAMVNISTDTTAKVYSTLHVAGSPSFRGDADGNRLRVTTIARSGSSGAPENCTIVHLLSSPSTSSTVYSVRLSHANDATQAMYINKSAGDPNQDYEGRAASSITVLEFEP